MVVRGPRLALRYAVEDDAPALFELARDPEVTRFFSWGPYRKPTEPMRYIESLERRRDAGTRLEFVIVGDDDAPIGVTGLSELSPRDRRAVIGTWLGRRFWGTGANEESKSLLLALAFRRLGLLRVSALASPDNRRSIVALERLGFELEGVLRGWQVHEDERRDCAILRLSLEEWQATPLSRAQVEFEGEPPRAFVVGPTPT